MKDDTKLVSAGRRKKHTGVAVNPHLVRASTIVFDTVDDMHHAARYKEQGVEYYGRHGTSTTFAFADAMCELENAAGCFIYPCGLSAITATLSSFLAVGDHLLMVDSVYEPTRNFCNGILARYGVEVTYYDPLVGAEIADLIQSNTKVIFLESPGSLTMEVQDIPAIVAVAAQHDIVTMIDNTYASPLNFKPLDFGVDISIHSATKYINGHSDVMLGVASANQRCWPGLQANSYQLGLCASADDIYTGLRGLRTLGVRLRQHAYNAHSVAQWLAERVEVDHVRHPALATCPGHEFYQRDFQGDNGLFSFVLTENQRSAIDAMVNGMRHFKMGFSWGGYESLILAASDFSQRRTAVPWDESKGLIRLHVGLEDPQDLIDDLTAGFARYNAALTSSQKSK